MKKLLMFFASLLLICSCSSDSDVLTGSVQGTVTEMIGEESLPLSDVIVSIDGGESVTTDNNGHYTFADIDAKSYKLRFNKFGYHSTTRDVNVIAGKMANCDVSLETEKEDLIVIDPASLSFGITQTELSVTITNKGSRELKWNLDLGQNSAWLSATPRAGQLGVEKKQTIVFTVNRENITEAKSVVVNLTAGGSSFPLTVDCGYDNGRGQLVVEPTDVDFGSELTERDITIKNLGTAPINWIIKNNASSCLTLSENSGSIESGGNTVLKLTLDRSKMDKNLITSFTISDGTNEKVVNVKAQYVERKGEMVVTPTILDYQKDLNDLSFTIQNEGNGTLMWKLKNINTDLLKFSDADGAIAPKGSKVVNVTLDRSKMDSKLSTAFVVSDGKTDITVNVMAEYFIKKADMLVDPTDIDFGKDLSELSFNITNKGNIPLKWKVNDVDTKYISLSETSGTIAADAGRSIKVSLNRLNMTGDLSTSFTVTDGSKNVKVTVRATYVEIKGSLYVSPTSLDYGREGTLQSITVKNVGAQTLTWKITNIKSNAMTFSDLDGATAPGGSKTINITLDRSKMTSDLNTSFTVTDGTNEVDVTVAAVYVKKEGKISVIPTSLDFGTDEVKHVITLKNIGSASLKWNVKNLTSDCIELSEYEGSIAPDGMREVIVSLNRSKMTSDLNTSFAITDGINDVNVDVKAKYIKKEGKVAVSPTSLDFGNEEIKKVITIKNVGNASMNWNVKNLSSDCLSLSEMDGGIAPEGSKQVTVTLDRNKMKEDLNTSFTVSDGKNDVNISVSARYVKKEGMLSIDKTDVDFGSDKNTVPIKISNKGNAPTDWTVKDISDANISLSPSSGTIAANNSKIVNVKLNRSTMTEDINNASFVVTDGVNSITVRVSAQMQKTVIKVTPSTLNYSATENTKTLVIANEGNVYMDWTIKDITESRISVSKEKGRIYPGNKEEITVSINKFQMKDVINTFFLICDQYNEETVCVNVELPLINQHEFVDLGLPSGLKWATSNVGASYPEQYGDYFAWGEIEPKQYYDYDNCKTYEVEMGDISSDPEYDVARAKWGGTWRMPTRDEFDELVKMCKVENYTLGGVNGQLITGPNGNSIFLPAAGHRYKTSLDNAGEHGNYWSSTPRQNYYAYGFNFDVRPGIGHYWYGRYNGYSIRPVSD